MNRKELEAMAERTTSKLLDTLNIRENRELLSGAFVGVIVQAFLAGRDAALEIAGRNGEHTNRTVQQTSRIIAEEIKALGESNE